jgi:hypothetical protein
VHELLHTAKKHGVEHQGVSTPAGTAQHSLANSHSWRTKTSTFLNPEALTRNTIPTLRPKDMQEGAACKPCVPQKTFHNACLT